MPKMKRSSKQAPSKPRAWPQILPPYGFTKEEADALPIPEEIPPALDEALTRIIKRLATAKGEGEHDEKPDSSNT